MYKQGAQLLLW